MLESDDPQIFTQDVGEEFLLSNLQHSIKVFYLFQLMLVTAQKRAALGECEARHKEILELEQNIRVRMNEVDSLSM